MDVSNMSAEQLRELAEQKEKSRANLEAKYLDFVPGKIERAPYERVIEFEDEEYVVDMRRTKSREFMRHMARVSDAEQNSPEALSPVLALYDYLFGGDCDNHVVDVVTKKLGYDDAEEILRIESALLEKLDAKN
ncbi:hypothetical protein Apar_0586 [Lancefieldella parvula DSM 20469]|jgi:hypothetical protein|uniref:Uncharacterized protein n=1 Tax=Lancefieldella parvula (strain ATCC 33793 / DSM 20469 / CCUG 32760 / JCM 10300 / KCTC 3663 / VPI 0546 / 1246) TaxID=521095 RepID=C8WA78_LANP1|nr:hypothetical protein [Lancefieldella parvula]ACV51016.1 hypothetical protein Apar_0586 [Lancefieldella parvula DSM 20469]